MTTPPSPARRVDLIQANTDEADANACTLDEARALLGTLRELGKTPRGALTQLLLTVAVMLHQQYDIPDGLARQQHVIDEIPTVLREMLGAIALEDAINAATAETTH
jgi:hypothetical protein